MMDLKNHSEVSNEKGAPFAEAELSLLDLLIVLAKNKRTLLLWPLLAAVVSVAASFLMTVTYQASVRILPPQQQQSAASMLASQLGSLAGLAGAGSAGGLLKNPNDLYVAMLKSNSISDRIIERFGLMELYGEKFRTDARKKLLANTTVSAGKDGIMVIDVIDEDPTRAAEMANALVEELVALTKRLAITEAQQRRLFFEKRLAQAKDSLANAEVALQKVQETTGLIKLDDQAKAVVESVARVRAQIAAKEVQVSVMRSYATELNPQLKIAHEELAGLRSQLSKLESRSPAGNNDKDGLFMATGKIPEAGLEYLRRFRDVKYHETIFELMAKQYEIARIDESREGAVIQVVDVAQPPERSFKPRRAFIVLMATFAALFVGVLWVFLREALRTAWSDPSRASRLGELRSALAWKR
jgi:tyrosine-protein kinase Etk/Wzc